MAAKMAAKMVYENEAIPEGLYEDIPCRDLSERTKDRKAAAPEATHEYDRLQRLSKCDPCCDVKRRALILGFIGAIVVTNVAVGVAVWTACSYPDKDTCTNRTKKVCEADWEYQSATDYCYRAFTDPMTFFQAERNCSSHGAHLASSRSLAEQIIVKGISHTNAGYWLGGNDIEKEGAWTWVDGQPIGPLLFWSQGEPSGNRNGDVEDCMNIPSIIPGWRAISCSSYLGFICSKPAEYAQT